MMINKTISLKNFIIISIYLLIALFQYCCISDGYTAEDSYPWELIRSALSYDHCELSNPGLCKNKEKCEGFNWYWYNNHCNPNKHPNQIKTEQLIGQWCEGDKNGNGVYYYVDKSTISEKQPGLYIITGGSKWLSECSYKINPNDSTFGTVKAWYDDKTMRWIIADSSEFHCYMEHQLNRVTSIRFEGCSLQRGYFCGSSGCESGTILSIINPP